MRRIVLALALWLSAMLVWSRAPAAACPFCPPSVSLAEQMQTYDVVVIVRWIDGVEGTDQAPGSTVYEVVEVLRDEDPPADAVRPDRGAPLAPAAVSPTTGELLAREPAVAPRPSDHAAPVAAKRVKIGDDITVAQYHPGEAITHYMLSGVRSPRSIDWDPAFEVSPLARKYLVEAPARDKPVAERLRYYLKHLESSDEQVASDAFAEFASAPYEDVAAIAKEFDRVKIRAWLENPNTQVTRTGLYGLMLGLCGNDSDARAMEAKIVVDTQDFRLGIDGLIFGYLLLTGEKGLEVVEQSKLVRADVPPSEVYSAMQALEFIWVYAADRIEKPRLRQSMRMFLMRPETAALAIPTLARWQDWSVQDRLMELYGEKDFDDPSTKRAIVRYLRAAVKAGAAQGPEQPAYAALAAKHLDRLRTIDPDTVEAAEKLLVD